MEVGCYKGVVHISREDSGLINLGGTRGDSLISELSHGISQCLMLLRQCESAEIRIGGQAHDSPQDLSDTTVTTPS
jgi:hypothetical protein